MKNSRVRLYDKKCPAFGISKHRLQEENNEIESFDSHARWNFYETRKFW